MCVRAHAGIFLKACASVFMMFNGHHRGLLSTFFQFFKNYNFLVFGGHFKVKIFPIFTKLDGKFLVGSRKGLRLKTGSLGVL